MYMLCPSKLWSPLVFITVNSRSLVTAVHSNFVFFRKTVGAHHTVVIYHCDTVMYEYLYTIGQADCVSTPIFV